MLTSLETGLGLDIVIGLQSMQNGVLDALGITLDFMGGNLFFLFVLPLVYWSINRKLGIQMLMAIIFSGLLNVSLKELFYSPRPYQVSDEVRLIVDAMRFGFPSGHVMTATVVWGYLAYVVKRTWVSVAVVIYVILMGWARMYVGAHYPQDVVGGVLFGIITLIIFIRLIDPFPQMWSRLDIQPKTALIVLAFIAGLVFVIQDETGAALLGVLAGVAIGGLMIEALNFNFGASSNLRTRAICFIVGMILLGALYFGLRLLVGAIVSDDQQTLEELLRVLRYFIVALFAYVGFPVLASRFDLVERKSSSMDVTAE